MIASKMFMHSKKPKIGSEYNVSIGGTVTKAMMNMKVAVNG